MGPLRTSWTRLAAPCGSSFTPHRAVSRAIDGEPAGAAASVITNGVLGIFGTGDRPAYRRRGVQSAIVAKALEGAIGRADLAIATTEPGSISQRTFERFGFQVLYTRAILLRT